MKKVFILETKNEIFTKNTETKPINSKSRWQKIKIGKISWK